MKRLLKKILCLLALAACMCAPLNGDGSGTNTGNGVIVGTIVDHSGKSAGGVGIRLRPSDYLQAPPWKISLTANPEIRETMTGSDGSFSIDSLPAGAYSVEANDNRGNAVLLRCSVLQDERTTTLAQAALEPYAAITGKVAHTSSGAQRYVQIYGLERCVAVDSGGTYTFGNLPAGIFTLRIICSDTATVPITIPAQQAFSGAITQIPPVGWLFLKKIHLNTTDGGAGVTGNVLDFPVLIRLTAANFDFTQARNNGEDIRFTKPDNTFLSYEIERWDPMGKKAEIWVKVDTIRGSDSAQSITMYWGNNDAASLSFPAAVFDTAAGFAGVWHLGESDSLAPDATGNHYDGTGYSTSSVAGMIGNARHFNGNSSVIRMKATAFSRLGFPMNGRYTVSAWVFHDLLADSVTYLVAGKGEHQYFIKNFDLALSIGQHARQWEFTEYHDNDWQSATFVPATAQSWVYLVGVRDGTNEYLYVNGSLAMSKIFAANQGQLSQDTSDDFAIGGFLRPVTTYNQGYAYFSGVIDEVTVSSAPRSADWVKLNYMSQKEKDMLVRW